MTLEEYIRMMERRQMTTEYIVATVNGFIESIREDEQALVAVISLLRAAVGSKKIGSFYDGMMAARLKDLGVCPVCLLEHEGERAVCG